VIFTRLAGTFAIVRLSPSAETPGWPAGELVSITRTRDELSVVCSETAVPHATEADRGWNCLKLEGPIPLTTVGVASEFTTLLAKAGVSVFLISTFDTDYLLIRAETVARAADALRAGGHTVRRPL
jgi:hypothetical protein